MTTLESSPFIDVRQVTDLRWGDMVRRKNRPLALGMVERVDGEVVHVRWGKDAPPLPERLDNLLLRL